MSWLIPLRAFFANIPLKGYVAAALLAAIPISYCAGERNGKQIILERLEQAEIEAKQKAAEARRIAGANAEERAREFEHEQTTIREAIEDAEANSGNALDSLFDSLP